MKSRPRQSRDGQPPEELRNINVELADLFRQQSAALEDAVFMGMTDEQREGFEKRRERIGKLIARLEKFNDAA